MAHIKDICPICLLDKPDIKTKCNHWFHNECLEKWLKIKPTCPVCRRCHTSTFKHTFIFTKFKRGHIKINKECLTITYVFSKPIVIQMNEIIKVIGNHRMMNIYTTENKRYKFWTKDTYNFISSLKTYLSY